MKKFKWMSKIICIVIVFIIIMFILIKYQSIYSWKELWDLVSESWLNSFLVIIGAYCLRSIIWVIPAAALYVGAGFLFPPFTAILITYAGLAIDLTLSFCLGRFFGKTQMLNEIRKKKSIEWVLDFTQKHDFMSCFIIRLIPGPPTEIISMFFGVSDIRYIHYLIASLLGMTPGMVPIIFVGKAAANPLSKEFIIPCLISLLLISATLGIYYIVRKRHEKTEAADAPEY